MIDLQPLKETRACDVTADFAAEKATAFRPHRYQFTDIDAVVLEGIFLFKRSYRAYFHLAFWVECTFETALERAAS